LSYQSGKVINEISFGSINQNHTAKYANAVKKGSSVKNDWISLMFIKVLRFSMAHDGIKYIAYLLVFCLRGIVIL
jgi:hypothetical protein